MVGQLLKITSTPIKFEYNVEPAKLEMRGRPLIPFAEVKTTQPQQKIHTENTKVNIDTYQARKSLGMYHTADAIKIESQKGIQNALKATGDAARLGWQISKNHQDGVNIAQLVQQKMMEQPDMVMKFLPEGGAELSWSPAVCDLSYQKGNVQHQWERPNMQYEYIPGKISMDIVQYPSVQIEYVGEPQYVPPSSAPNYEEPQ